MYSLTAAEILLRLNGTEPKPEPYTPSYNPEDAAKARKVLSLLLAITKPESPVVSKIEVVAKDTYE